jgi:hypothetical protein
MKKFTADDVDTHSDHEPDATYYDTREADQRIAKLDRALRSCRFALMKQREAMKQWSVAAESAIDEATAALHPTTLMGS